MNTLDKSDIVVVGGVAAGPKAAATLARRRPDWKITLFEKSDRISYGACGMPWFASGDISSFDELTKTAWGVERTPEFFARSKGFEVRSGTEVVAINRDRKTVTIRERDASETTEHGYEKLVLATGSVTRDVPFSVPDSEIVSRFTRPDDAINFRRLAEQGRLEEAIIIGSGLIGCELAEAVTSLWGIKATVIECEDQVLPWVLDTEMSALVETELRAQGVNLLTGARVRDVVAPRRKATVAYTVGSSERFEHIEADYVFLAVGVRPQTTLAEQAGLMLGAAGGIEVNEYMQTSDPDIYAGGDCVESKNFVTHRPMYLPMGSLANRHGRVIAEHIVGNRAKMPHPVGAFIVKVFDLNVGAVGLTEHAAASHGMKAQTVWGSFSDRPDYYPENESMVLKMVYRPYDMRLLGLQAVGKGDIARRLDVFSSFLQRDGHVGELLEFEHVYAPPYSEALDPMHHLAAMAQAQRRGVRFLSAECARRTPDKALWLDVREDDEITATPLFDDGNSTETVHICLNDLRSQLDKVDKNRELYVVCRRGPRAYQAALLLKAKGFENVTVVAGGTTAFAR